jgi:phosphoribosyl 1,2-cyclic phosphate phosphodiesterase
MKSYLTILGCGNSHGVPMIDGFWGKCDKKNKKNHRTRCSAFIKKGNNSVLIDTSPDIKKQLFDNKIKDITSIIYTHEHADQTNGLFEIRPFYWKSKKKINIYGSLQTIKNLKLTFPYIFFTMHGYSPIAKPNIIKKNFSLGKDQEKINFKSCQVKHGPINSTAYIFENTGYLSDCNDLSIVKIKSLRNLNYLILDCLRYRKSPVHFGLNEALYVHNILKPKKTILTNLNCELDYTSLLRILPKNVLPAYDGMKLKL